MKAIVSVNKNSNYAYLNGHTFNVESIYDTRIGLNINGTKIAFEFSEVFIVDLQSEMQKYFDEFNWYGKNTTYTRLQAYCAIKNFESKVIYNCPA